MSFKKFSLVHTAPSKDKPAVAPKAAPLVDQPPAPAAAKPAPKS